MAAMLLSKGENMKAKENVEVVNNNNDFGYITAVVGPIVDVCFPSGNLPEVLTALKIPLKNGGKLVTEIEQHVGDDTVRSVAMGPTDGLVRGMKVINTHKCIEVPGGDATLGRMFNVLGEPIDDMPLGENLEKAPKESIH